MPSSRQSADLTPAPAGSVRAKDPANGEPLLLRVGEAARLLDCSTRLIWRLASEGHLPRVRLGPRSVRFRRSDVEGLIDDLAEG